MVLGSACYNHHHDNDRLSEEQRVALATMSPEQRTSLIQKHRALGKGLIVAGVGTFAGVCGGLWNSVGAGALGVGMGAATGLWVAAWRGPLRYAKQVDQVHRDQLAASTFGGNVGNAEPIPHPNNDGDDDVGNNKSTEGMDHSAV